MCASSQFNLPSLAKDLSWNKQDIAQTEPPTGSKSGYAKVDREHDKMTPLKAIFLTLFMLSAIGLWGFGIYTADAGTNQVAIDGYGVVASTR